MVQCLEESHSVLGNKSGGWPQMAMSWKSTLQNSTVMDYWTVPFFRTFKDLRKIKQQLDISKTIKHISGNFVQKECTEKHLLVVWFWKNFCMDFSLFTHAWDIRLIFDSHQQVLVPFTSNNVGHGTMPLVKSTENKRREERARCEGTYLSS